MELRSIPGWEWIYAASDDGRIWSHRSTRFLSTYLTNGYKRVDLSEHSRATKARVHRLVALAWHPNPESLPEINHIDGNKANNTPTNLEWCDRSENITHSYRTGTRKATGAHCPGAKLTIPQVAAIKARLAAGEKCIALAGEFSVSPNSIRSINCGTRWRDVASAPL